MSFGVVLVESWMNDLASVSRGRNVSVCLKGDREVGCLLL